MSTAEINQSSGLGGDGGGDWPKASIGNYKGVMLCNRPNEFGQQKRPERTGLEPFNSRVDPKLPLGWNPSAKLLPRQTKKKSDPNSILVRHKKFLRQLEKQKNAERDGMMEEAATKDNKTKAFKDQAARQRAKIMNMKQGEVRDEAPQPSEQYLEEVTVPEPTAKPQALTAENLDRHSRASKSVKAPSVASSKKGRKAQKPAWAKTQDQIEEQKEDEIDDLLEFAYELDYEKYMEDYEVRQALAIIKDRVNEITADPDWKAQIADEWNQAQGDARRAEPRQRRETDSQSQVTYQTHKTNASKASYISRVSEAKRREATEKPEWNQSTTSEKRPSAEDRIATKIASEVLRDNAKLRGIHSANSIKILLEKEAKKQMAAVAANGGEYQGPVIAVCQEKGPRDKADPSNLPYLHKNPAV